jgi:hypothetical protein
MGGGRHGLISFPGQEETKLRKIACKRKRALKYDHMGKKSNLPGSMGTIDVVEAANAELNAEVFAVVLAELLGGELLETVGVLGVRGPSIALLEAGVRGVQLLELGVTIWWGNIEASGSGRAQEDDEETFGQHAHASRRRVEVSLDARTTSSLHHVEAA